MGLVNQELVLFNKIIFANIAYGKGRNHATLEKIKNATKLVDAHMFISGLQKVRTKQSISNINFLMVFTVISKLLFFISTIQNDSHDTAVGDLEVQLCKVQKQQRTIAHTIIRSPTILLIDKATSSLDTDYERVV